MLKQCIAATCIFGMALQGYAGYIISSEDKDLGTGEVRQNEVLIDGLNLRIDAEEAGQDAEMIFRGDRKVMYVIQEEEQEYIEVNQEMFKNLSAQIDSAMSELETQMAGMPPEQQAMMKQMMGGIMNQAAKPPVPVIEVEANGKTREIHGISCAGYSVSRDGQLTREIYAAPYGEVPNGENVMAVMKSMGSFFEDLVSELNNPILKQMMENPFESIEKVDGYPMQIIRYNHGIPAEQTTMSLPEEGSVDASEFEPPAGFNKVDPTGEM